jgi:hypothetical protein
VGTEGTEHDGEHATQGSEGYEEFCHGGIVVIQRPWVN